MLGAGTFGCGRFHLVPYGVRVCLCAVLMFLSFVTVGYGRSTGMQLLGVCFSSLQGGLGEASLLALSSFYDTPRALTAWSSGTGFAGIFGYAWVVLFKFWLGLSFRASLMTANVLVLFWLYAYFILLVNPNSPLSNGNGVISSDTTDEVRFEADSPLAFQQLTTSPSLNSNGEQHNCIVEREEVECASPSEASRGRSSRVGSGEARPSRAATMTAFDRFRFTLGLWRFTVPLMLVYFAEVSLTFVPSVWAISRRQSGYSADVAVYLFY